MKKVAIIGLGLIGGSIGMGLRAARLEELHLVGYSRSHETRAKAKQKGAVDETASSLASCVEGASMVVLATPVMAIESILREMGPLVADGCVVTDAASTKAAVMRWASHSLRPGTPFVGGHPMAGKEVAGIDVADPGLFQGCTYCICPAPGASAGAVEAVTGMASLLGARPFFLDPSEHDSFVAGISHLPMLLSTALASVTTSSPAWREMSRLASSGFRDTTRLASSDPVMSRDIYLTNRESLGYWLDILVRELESLREDINSEGGALEARLRSVKEARDRWQKGEVPGEPAVPSEAPAGGWGHFLLGNLQSQLSRKTERPR